MRFYTRAQEPLSLNVTPLIDVVFLLLIFFMTSTTFSGKTSALEITLPSLHVMNEVPVDNTLRIGISAKGEYVVNDKRLPAQSLSALTHALTVAQAFDANTVVLIAADAKAPYQAVMRAMDAAGKLGYGHIQLEGQAHEHGNV